MSGVSRRSVLAGFVAQLVLPWHPPRPHRYPARDISDLRSHAGPCTPRQLAVWWGYSEDTVVRWIVEGYRTCRHRHCRSCPRVVLHASRRLGRWPRDRRRYGRAVREWEIRVRDALAFEVQAGFNLRRPNSRM